MCQWLPHPCPNSPYRNITFDDGGLLLCRFHTRILSFILARCQSHIARSLRLTLRRLQISLK